MELESVPKATRRIAELKREITALGSPIIGAIEEFERVNERYTYLSEQRDDVEQAKEELTEHHRPDHRADDRDLRPAVPAAQRELSGRPFWSCSAAARPRWSWRTESDILNCGIEIKVQPPGKAAQDHHAAVRRREGVCGHRAVLRHSEGAAHALLRHGRDRGRAGRANVVRFARYMRRIAGKTQFIVITHRRGTMEEADVLYGVTMQEQGVSRMLTINLNDMAKELHIK